MYLGIDIGGTKTLVAVFTNNGHLRESLKFETSQNYSSFESDLTNNIKSLKNTDFDGACIAFPGPVDRVNRIGVRFGNLPWKNVNTVQFLEKLINTPVVVENDAKLAGLYEANNVIGDFKKVVYITISTGIGIALIVNGVIDSNVGDRGGNAMMLEHGGKTISWENLASGKAITKRYGKKASEIDDPKVWKVLAHDFALGIVDVIALMEPEAIIIGGGVGAHFDKFGDFLETELHKYKTPIAKYPKILPAKKPEEAVIYGCYLFAKQHSK